MGQVQILELAVLGERIGQSDHVVGRDFVVRDVQFDEVAGRLYELIEKALWIVSFCLGMGQAHCGEVAVDQAEF